MQHIGSNEIRRVTLMCSNCFAISEAVYSIDFMYTHNMKLHMHAELISEVKKKFKNGLDIEGSCDKCKGSTPIIIDPNIAETVSILNKKGYKTKFSCNGHKNEGVITIPYISFSDKVPISIFNNLPRGWRLDVDGDFISKCMDLAPVVEQMPSIYYHPAETSSLINFNKNKLITWASHLPDMKEFYSEHFENSIQE